MFAARIRQWLKTLRKKNVSPVIFATQSFGHIDGSTIAPAIIESCASRIFPAEPAGDRTAGSPIYRRFGLNSRQIPRSSPPHSPSATTTTSLSSKSPVRPGPPRLSRFLRVLPHRKTSATSMRCLPPPPPPRLPLPRRSQPPGCAIAACIGRRPAVLAPSTHPQENPQRKASSPPSRPCCAPLPSRVQAQWVVIDPRISVQNTLTLSARWSRSTTRLRQLQRGADP